MPYLQDLAAETLADKAHHALRQAIVEGELAPGEKITERDVAGRLGVSPTPVREALRRLEQEQLIERTGPRTVRVVDVDRERRAELGMIEGALRAVAARLAAENATDDQTAIMGEALDAADESLRAMRAAVRGKDRDAQRTAAEEVLAHLRTFHATVDEACGNPVLLRLLDTVEAFTFADRRAALERQLDRAKAAALKARYVEHRAIFDAILAGDGERAEQLMTAHTRAASAQLAESLAGPAT